MSSFANAPTLDPNFKGAAVTVSGGNLTATVTSGTGAIGSINWVSGPVYFEMAIGATLTGVASVGVTTFDFVTTGQIGSDTTSRSCGYQSSGSVLLNNVVVATLAAYVANSNIGVAVNPLTQLIWFRVNGGNWNNDVIANQNPATNTGGIPLNLAKRTFIAGWSGAASSSATYLPTSATWVYAAPSGYQGLNVLQATAISAGFTSAGVDFAIPSFIVTLPGIGSGSASNSPIPVAPTLPPGYVGIAYTETVIVEGGTGPYTMVITAGSLPLGLSFNGTTGVISGTPTTITPLQSVTITATDSTGRTNFSTFQMEVDAPSGGATNYGFAS